MNWGQVKILCVRVNSQYRLLKGTSANWQGNYFGDFGSKSKIIENFFLAYLDSWGLVDSKKYIFDSSPNVTFRVRAISRGGYIPAVRTKKVKIHNNTAINLNCFVYHPVLPLFREKLKNPPLSPSYIYIYIYIYIYKERERERDRERERKGERGEREREREREGGREREREGEGSGEYEYRTWYRCWYRPRSQ